MNGRQSKSQLHPQILEQASTWFVEFSEGDIGPASREEFMRWLRASPEHVRGYLEIAALWEYAPLVDRKREAGADVLIARALAQGNVVPLELPGWQTGPSGGKAGATSGARNIRPRRRFAIAAAVAAIAMTGGLIWHGMTRVPVYETAVGEQRFVPLADGSTVDLNSRSRIRVRFDEAERYVDLIEGQALFHVAKDPQRPFTVQSGEVSVRAVGTQFDVHRRRSGTTVTVLEGRVSVVKHEATLLSPARTGAGPVLVTAGEQVTVTPQGRARPQAANVAAATAWTRHEIVFEGAALSDVVEEFNRYNARHLVIDDPGIEGTRISGVFSSTDPGSLLMFLRGLPDFRIVEEEDAIRISGR